MRICLTQYSMRQNPVYPLRLRHCRYSLAFSAAGPRSSWGLETQQGKLRQNGMDKDRRKGNPTFHSVSASVNQLPGAGFRQNTCSQLQACSLSQTIQWTWLMRKAAWTASRGPMQSCTFRGSFLGCWFWNGFQPKRLKPQRRNMT